MCQRCSFRMAALAAAVLLVGGCFDDDSGGDDVDAALSLECLEPRGNARGALLEFRWMANGERRVDTSTIEGAETFMRQLAAQAGAPDAVRQDLDRWEAALAAWDVGLRRIEPRIVNGQFVEPDTTALDRRLLAELAPLAERLGAWVETSCEGAR